MSEYISHHVLAETKTFSVAAGANEEDVGVSYVIDVAYRVVATRLHAIRETRVSEEVLVSIHIWPRRVGRWLASRGKEV